MYVSFDFKCFTCGEIDSRLVPRKEMDEQFCSNMSCATAPMVRLPAGTRTTFKFADTKLKS